MKDKILKTIIKFVPIIIVGIILVISSYMFDLNKKQTCERVRNLKESQIKVLANQVDLGTSMDPDYLQHEDNIKLLKKSIESINEQAGVYCYLFDKDCNLVSNFSKTQKHITGEAIMDSLMNNNIDILITEEYQGYISTTASNNEKFLIYWHGLPSGNRDACDYFIILTVSENEIQENEAISSCKVMISILTISLCISLYANLYMKPYYNKDN